MNLKYIKLFENFQINISESNRPEDIIFDWLPFDSEVNNPINNSLPKEISYNDFPNWVSENMGSSTLNEAAKAGIYVAHFKDNKGGFNRVIVKQFDPLKVDFSTFNQSFEKNDEYEGVDFKDIFSIAKGSSIARRFDI